MNNISIAKFSPKKWIVQKEKFNRYKVFNAKKRFSKCGCSAFVYDYGDRLVFKRLDYKGVDESGKVSFSGSYTADFKKQFTLKIKNNHTILWEFKKDRQQISIRNFSCLPNSLIDWIYPNAVRRKQNGKSKIHFKRLNDILVNFLKRHNIKFKYTKDFGENLFKANYPAAREFYFPSFAANFSHSRFLLKPTIKEAIKAAFGYESRKLVKEVCSKIVEDSDFSVLSLGPLFRPLLSLDNLYKILGSNIRKEFGIGSGRRNLKTLKKIFKKYNQERIIRLCNSSEVGNYIFRDTLICFQYNENTELPKKPKNWQEIHDVFVGRGRARELNLVHKLEEFELPVKEKYAKIDGAEFDGFKIEIPKHTSKLAEYSNKMQNCIRGYGRQVVDGFCDLIAVYKDGELKYNISVNGNKIGQFKAKFNQEPPDDDKKVILKFLEENKIIIESETERFRTEYGAEFINRDAVAEIRQEPARGLVEEFFPF